MNADKYGSWGRYPKVKAKQALQARWRDEIPKLSSVRGPILPYGYGKSYGDSCLNEGGSLIDTSGLNRFISFNPETGVLKCEAGVTLEQIMNFAVPRGWGLYVTPGTKFLSVAGCIANDVHGKNHHADGTFGLHTLKFELLRSDDKAYICSPEENTGLYKATIGGLGLTGLITWAEIQLKRYPSPYFYTENVKFNSIEEFLDINLESEEEYEYTVSWVDTTGSGPAFGRGIYNRGNLAGPDKYEIPEEPAQKKLPFPFDAPFINSLSTRIFNTLYFNKQFDKVNKGLTHYEQFYYPLDAVIDWNKAYGRQGFMQYQFVVPKENGRRSIEAILGLASESGLSSFLTVLKTFGSIESPGMLSFPREGITMAIDFKNTPAAHKLMNELDKEVIGAGGVLYPAKDARMRGSDFRKFYPEWEEFIKYKDPKFSSSFWRRVMV